ncbi:MAG: zinc ribbon domain-containing protein [Gemmatimonadetes bacterium]|nr:zinc ribbon domain-containing protein [Gemmatimonadota bacterium]
MLGCGVGFSDLAFAGAPMPIYEYECRECRNRFELLLLGSTTPTCPVCEATDIEKVCPSPRPAPTPVGGAILTSRESTGARTRSRRRTPSTKRCTTTITSRRGTRLRATLGSASAWRRLHEIRRGFLRSSARPYRLRWLRRLASGTDGRHHAR